MTRLTRTERTPKPRKRLFVCERCGGRWNYPVGIHLPGGADSGPAWCPVNARERKAKRRKEAR